MSLSRKKKTAARRRRREIRRVFAAAAMMKRPHVIQPWWAPPGVAYLVDMAALELAPKPIDPRRFEVRLPEPVIAFPPLPTFLGGL